MVGATGEAAELAATVVELGGDCRFPRIEELRRSHVVIVQHESLRTRHHVVADRRPDRRLVEDQVRGRASRVLAEIATAVAHFGMHVCREDLCCCAHVAQEVVDSERVLPDRVASGEHRSELVHEGRSVHGRRATTTASTPASSWATISTSRPAAFIARSHAAADSDRPSSSSASTPARAARSSGTTTTDPPE